MCSDKLYIIFRLKGRLTLSLKQCVNVRMLAHVIMPCRLIMCSDKLYIIFRLKGRLTLSLKHCVHVI